MTWITSGALAPQSDDERARRVRAARRHTRRVKTLRVMLPVSALLLIGGLVASSLTPSLSFLPDGVSLDGISFDGERVTMERPHLTGFGTDGNAYEVRADRAEHLVAEPKVLELYDVIGQLTEPSGRRTRLMADFGIFDGNEEFLELSQGIEINMDGGYRMFLEDADVDMKDGTVVTDNPVRIETNGADLTADTLRVSENGKHFFFNGNVHMIVYPDAAQGGDVAPGDAGDTASVGSGG
ncbi:MAG: LPS export ABC transporter periplasmic protein LptC [Pseudomonadota bacterium]